MKKNDKELYIEKRCNSNLFDGLNYNVIALIRLDLINKKVIKISVNNFDYLDKNMLEYLGIEFLLNPLVNNDYFVISGSVFVKSIFGDYTNPVDILKKELLNKNIPIENFPMTEFKDIIIRKKSDIWGEGYQDYDLFLYMKNTTNISVLFKHIRKLKEEIVRNLFLIAKNLDYKVDMSWSISRITEQYKKWLLEIKNKALLAKDNEKLDILTIEKLPKIKNANLITNRYDLIYEGMEIHHCVGVDFFWNEIKQGNIAVYSYDDSKLRVTIEVILRDNTFNLGMVQGKYNKVGITKIFKNKITKQLKNEQTRLQ